MDPTNDNVVYIGVEQDGFFKSFDGGATWQKIVNGVRAWDRTDGNGLCYEEFYETVIDAKDPARVCFSQAGSPGTLASLNSARNNGIYCSGDGGKTWSQRLSPTMNTAVYTLAVDPNDFDTMYAGVNGGACSTPPPVCQPDTYFNTTGAIYKTTDGGKTWTELNARYEKDMRVVAVRVDQSDPKVVIAATFSKLSAASGGAGNFASSVQHGVLRSVDGGMTWTSSVSGMNSDPREQALLFMEVASANALQVYVTASSNPSYWSADGGKTFNKAARMTALAFDPHDPSGLHLIGCSGDSIKESRDGGKTWKTLSKTPGFVSVGKGLPTDFEWSRQDPKVIYMSGPYAALYKTADGGATWSQVLSPEKLPK